MATILHAYLPQDGSGILEQDGKVYLIEYPYRDASVKEIDRNLMDSLVERGGYYSRGKSFDSIQDVVQFLEKVANEFAEGTLEKFSDDDYISQYNALPSEMIEAILDELEDEFLEQGELETSLLAINRLLSLERIRSNDKFQRRLARLKMQIERLQAMQFSTNSSLEQNHIYLIASAYQGLNAKYGISKVMMMVRQANAHQLHPARQ